MDFLHHTRTHLFALSGFNFIQLQKLVYLSFFFSNDWRIFHFIGFHLDRISHSILEFTSFYWFAFFQISSFLNQFFALSRSASHFRIDYSYFTDFAISPWWTFLFRFQKEQTTRIHRSYPQVSWIRCHRFGNHHNRLGILSDQHTCRWSFSGILFHPLFHRNRYGILLIQTIEKNTKNWR